MRFLYITSIHHQSLLHHIYTAHGVYIGAVPFNSMSLCLMSIDCFSQFLCSFLGYGKQFNEYLISDNIMNYIPPNLYQL